MKACPDLSGDLPPAASQQPLSPVIVPNSTKPERADPTGGHQSGTARSVQDQKPQ